MRIEQITPNIFHVNFRIRTALSSTFLRFQEHFESPEFKGKIFTLEEFKKWYTINSPIGKTKGVFTYYTDWSGFNIPSEILHPFFQGKFDPLSEQELKFLKLFKDKIKKEEKFYIIGTYGRKDDYWKKEVLRHEIGHGLFYTNPEYKKEVLKILQEIKPEKKEKITKFLKDNNGYHESVWEDEVHAYLITDLKKLEKHGVDISDLKETQEKLLAVFDKHLPNF